MLVEHAPNGACVLSRALVPPSPNFWDLLGKSIISRNSKLIIIKIKTKYPKNKRIYILIKAFCKIKKNTTLTFDPGYNLKLEHPKYPVHLI